MGSAFARMCSVPTTVSATRERRADDAVAAAEQRPLLGRRAGGDGQRRAPRVGHGQAGVECPGGGAHDLRQPGAGLDRLRDRVERLEVTQLRQPQK